MTGPPAELLEWDFARVSEAMEFNHQQINSAAWGIKGHNRPWIVARGGWEPGMRVLDVGAGYSDLAYHLMQTYDLEAWVADDYGAESDEPVWGRWGDPSELPSKFAGVHYVFKRLGDAVPELPPHQFDRVFSVSVLEHVPALQIEPVLDHMYRLLKPGGTMLHTVDLPFPRMIHGSDRAAVIRLWIRLAVRASLIRWGIAGYARHVQSVEGWSRLIRNRFDLVGKMSRLSTWQMVLDQDVLVEPPDVVYRFYPPNDQPKPYWRAASLKFVIRKSAEAE